MIKKFGAVLLAAVLVIGAAGCAKKVEPDPSGISKAEYDKIRIGMDEYDVNDIIGGNGELVSEQEEKPDEDHIIYTRIYKYKGETTGSADLTFRYDVYYYRTYENGTKLIAKDENGLE